MLRAVLFDFNGVLVDDEPLHFQLVRKVLEEEGLSVDEEVYHRRWIGLDDRACFTAILTDAGRTADLGKVMRLTARKASYYQATIRREGYPFFAGALELLRACHAEGWMLGVVSGALRDEVEGALHQEGVAGLIKILVTAEDVGVSKPDPEGYLQGLERLNAEPPLPDRLVHPHEVLAVEDTPAGLQAAGAAGLQTLGLAHTFPPERLSEATAVRQGIEGLTVAELQRLSG